MTCRLLPLALTTLLAQSASSQISTDRPGLAFSASTVGARVFQVEAGTPEATFGGSDSYRVPAALRYGLTPGLEARVSATVIDAIEVDDGTSVGLGFDVVTLGVKVSVPVSGASLAVIPEALVPTDGDGDVTFQVNAPATFTAGAVGLTLVPGLVTGNGSTTLNAVANLSRAFGTITGYAEAGVFPTLDDGGTAPVQAGAGILVLAGANTQFDAFFDAGLTDTAPDLLIGVGVSFRFN